MFSGCSSVFLPYWTTPLHSPIAEHGHMRPKTLFPRFLSRSNWAPTVWNPTFGAPPTALLFSTMMVSLAGGFVPCRSARFHPRNLRRVPLTSPQSTISCRRPVRRCTSVWMSRMHLQSNHSQIRFEQLVSHSTNSGSAAHFSTFSRSVPGRCPAADSFIQPALIG